MVNDAPSDGTQLVDDPLCRNCFREACFVLGLWACCFVYTVSYCYLNGYSSHEPSTTATGPDVANLLGPLPEWNRDSDSITYPLGLGIPDWVFYGIFLPWFVCIVASFWYCLFFFVEDDLSAGTDQEKGEAA